MLECALDSTGLEQSPAADVCERGTGPSGSITAGKFSTRWSTIVSTSTDLHSTLLHVTVQKADKHNLPGPRRMRVRPSKLRPYIHMAWVNNLLINYTPNNVT